MAAPTYVALEGVTRSHGTRALLSDVTLGVTEGARVGVVGRNGGGKTTFLEVLHGTLPVDSGRVVRLGGLSAGLLAQADSHGEQDTLRHLVVGDRPDHDWAGDARVRSVFDGLLGGVTASGYRDGLDTLAATMSGGERRRVELARLLVADPDLLLLDEPTNHLDVEAVDWLARYLAARRGSLVAVTHDRWFLDAVCTQTWEVVDGSVQRYEGGYAAYVLAKAERSRQAAASEDRRQNLLRKELAWLRRGPPARTSKPRFRIEAANALIADEPPPRDRLELERFATSRLGKQVLDLEDVSLAPAAGAPEVVHRQTWRLGPGDRVGLLGPNGAGKTTDVRLLAAPRRGELDLSDGPVLLHGTVAVGRTVEPAHLSQSVVELDDSLRVLELMERHRRVVELGKGRTVTAQQLLEGFGFTGERLVTRVGDLSGGERRRLQLMALLVDGPNVLLLDEPTNDLDVEMLQVLEDLLDSWPGTLVVVSHDRYFLERVTDSLYALLGDGRLRHLPGGVEEYLRLRAADATPAAPASPGAAPAARSPGGGATRAARKDLARIERRLERLRAEEVRLHEAMAAAATDHTQVLALDEQLRAVLGERDALEDEWLGLAEDLEG